MRPRIMPVVVLALVAVALAGGVAYAAILPGTTEYTTADECYTCHQGTGAAVTRADFSVAGPVNYTKCGGCHFFPNTNSHYHLAQPASECARCHNDYNYFALDMPADATIVGAPRTTTPYGYFAYADSIEAAPAELHALHDGGGWVERAWGTTQWPSGYPWAWGATPCSGCHAAATCTACHDAPPAAHADHAVSAYPAVSVRQATGTAISYTASTCINPACHDLAKTGTAGFTPTCGSCHPTKTTAHGYVDVDHVAADSVVDGAACTACHSLDLATVHGDATAIGTSCATCHPTPRDSFAAWDQSCVTGGCHTATSTAPMHGDMDADHAAIPSASGCPKCHSMDLATEHAINRSLACTVCHGNPAYDTLFAAGWNHTCDQCHPARHQDRITR